MRSCPHCGTSCPASAERCTSCGAIFLPAQGDEPGKAMKVAIVERDPLLGVVLGGQYRLEERIGEGAMGQVYRAQHLASGRDVAVKILNPDDAADPTTARRFQQEARAMSRLRHPNNLAVIDFGQTSGGLLYLVTEILRGRTLGAILRAEAPLAPGRIVNLLSQALEALAEAHDAGVIHRDFKPENVFVEPAAPPPPGQAPRGGGEEVRVIDYGIAKLRNANTRLTESGSVCGTPDYMAPEQIRGAALDGRADVYAAGVILYEMLTGSRPFAGSMLNVLSLHLHHPPEPPQLRRLDVRVPVALETVCLRALVKDPARRIASAGQMRSELQAALAHVDVEAESVVAPLDGTHVTSGEPHVAHNGTAVTSPATPRPSHAFLPFLGAGGRAEALALCTSPSRRAVVVLGAPGSGRSRLVDEWRRRLAERGERVVVLRADPSGARASWRPVRRALSEVLGLPERPTSSELDAATAARAGDRLGLREVFGLAPVAMDVERPFRRREALAAAVNVLREAGAALACDDVDRYDRPSVEVVYALLQDGGAARVVATAASRGGLFDMAGMADGAGVEVAELGPLAPRDVEALDLDVDLLDVAPGALTPLAIEQARRASLEGAEDASAGARLDALLPSVRRVLAAAVVAGCEIDAALLATALGHPPGMADVLAPVASLASRGLVRYESGRVVLPSPTLRDALYAALPVAERRALHETLAAHLAARDEDPAILAHHLWSHDADAAPVEALERAMTAAHLLHDDAGAARWAIRALKRAREAARRGVASAVRARLSLSLGDCLLALGYVARAEAAFREALGHGGDDARTAALAHRGLGRAALFAGRLDAAERELAGAIEHARDDSLAAELHLETAAVRDRLGRAHDAETALIQGSVRAPATPEVSWRLLLALAEHAHGDGRADDAQVLAQQALRAADGCTPLAAARVHALLAAVGTTLADGSAGTHRRAAAAALRRLGDRRATAELLLDGALAQISASGDNGDGGREPRAALAEAGELARQVGWSEGVARAQAALRARG